MGPSQWNSATGYRTRYAATMGPEDCTRCTGAISNGRRGDLTAEQRNKKTDGSCTKRFMYSVAIKRGSCTQPQPGNKWGLETGQGAVAKWDFSNGIFQWHTFATLNANVQWHHGTFREVFFKMKAGTWKPQGALASWTATMACSRTKRAAIQRLSQYIETHGQKICKRTFSYYCSFA